MINKGKTILIIEDEAPMLKVLSETLTENSFEVIQSTNGQDGLALALQKHPQIILLDILMPKMDGQTMLHKLREDDWGKTVPVVVLSNISPDNDSDLQAIIQNQPAYYFMKSNIKLDELVEKIKELLSNFPLSP